MNRNQLILSALLVGSMAVQTAYSKEASQGKRTVSSPQNHTAGGGGAGKVAHTKPADKASPKNFGSAGSGKGADKTGPKNLGSAVSGKTADKATPKNWHSLSNGTTEKSHLERAGHDRDERAEHREHGERGEHERGGHHYDERHYSYRGHDFDRRTYYEHGVEYHRFYQPYYYRGISFHVYAPGVYYAPAFYGWAYNPWAVPVAFEWGWGARPWYGYYGGWFRPYPVYASPSAWLTDYLLAQTLEAAYEARFHAAVVARADYSSTPMTPEVKQAVAEEVRRQIDLENSEARTAGVNPPDPGSSSVARMLGDHASHVFVVDAGLRAKSATGSCPLSEGDVIQLSGTTAPNATAVNVVVLATKGGDCRKGASVTVGLVDLQEMQNHMRATIDQGMVELRSKQGKGLPAAPATKPPAQAAYAAIAPPQDPQK